MPREGQCFQTFSLLIGYISASIISGALKSNSDSDPGSERDSQRSPPVLKIDPIFDADSDPLTSWKHVSYTWPGRVSPGGVDVHDYARDRSGR